MGQSRFRDRHAAGRELAGWLTGWKKAEPLVLALPRGGVPIGYEIARALGAPLEVLLVRKIGSPGHAEFGLGAVVEGLQPEVVLNQRTVDRIPLPEGYLERTVQQELQELERRREHYRGNRRLPSLLGRTIIVADDGIATGGTMLAALKALARAGARDLILAVPVAPADTLSTLREEADEVICLTTPEPFYAVGNAYDNFDQLEDAEVMRLLDSARHGWDDPSANLGSGRPSQQQPAAKQ